MNKETIFQTLNTSRAGLLSERKVNEQVKLALWKNKQDHVIYNTDKTHTLSLYIKGGAGCQRIDGQSTRGKQGALCLFPIGGTSEWLIDDEFQFFHLYFSDTILKRFYARVLDKEPQRVSVPDLTFHSDQQLASLAYMLSTALKYNDSSNYLAVQEKINHIFFHLLNNKNYCVDQNLQIKGGLSPAASRKVSDYIDAHYHQKIGLTELANLVQLSEYHFQRMFKITLGMTPHHYLTEVRIEKAQSMILKDMPLAQVAQQCGFSHQSHFNNVFKKTMGLSPKEYLKVKST